MEAHITENAQKLLEEKNQLIEAYRENMRKVQSASITAGAQAMLKIILKIATDNKTPNEKVNKITEFCLTGLGEQKIKINEK